MGYYKRALESSQNCYLCKKSPFYSAPSFFAFFRNLVQEIWFQRSGCRLNGPLGLLDRPGSRLKFCQSIILLMIFEYFHGWRAEEFGKKLSYFANVRSKLTFIVFLWMFFVFLRWVKCITSRYLSLLFFLFYIGMKSFLK